MSERERHLLEERNQIVDGLAQLDQERAKLQARLTFIDLELGI